MRHGALVVLGDEQAALRLAMKVAVHLRDEVRLWREELRFLEGLRLGEVHLQARAPEAPCRRVIHTRHLLRRVVGAEREAEAGGANLIVEEPVRARAHALEAGGTAPAKRHGGARQGAWQLGVVRARKGERGNVSGTRVAVGRGRRAAFVARALRRTEVLLPKLAQPQRARPNIPRARFFLAPAGGRYRARAHPKNQLF
jgi:hypothetical protein